MLKKTGSAWVCMSKVKIVDEEIFLSINNIKRRKNMSFDEKIW